MDPLEQNANVLSVSATARLLGKSEDWVRHKIRTGEIPARRISPNRLAIFHKELMQWLDGLECVARPRLYAEPDTELMIDVSDCEIPGSHEGRTR